MKKLLIAVAVAFAAPAHAACVLAITEGKPHATFGIGYTPQRPLVVNLDNVTAIWAVSDQLTMVGEVSVIVVFNTAATVDAWLKKLYFKMESCSS